eukprot:2548143-Pyramimonas_sp.AAC.1
MLPPLTILAKSNTKPTLPPNPEHAQPTRCAPPPVPVKTRYTIQFGVKSGVLLMRPESTLYVFLERDGGATILH